MGKENIICGRKVIREVINSPINIDKFYISKSVNKSNLEDILKYAFDNEIETKFVLPNDIDVLCDNNIHQGIAAKISGYKYFKFNELMDETRDEEFPFVLVLENVQDPRNLGSILRTSECMGIKNIIVPQKKSSGITNTVWKTSMGAVAHLNICRTNNLVYVIEKFKQEGFKIVATSLNTDVKLSEENYDYPIVMIVGNEKDGVSDELLEMCNTKVKIPMFGKVNSFNVSVATGIVLYEIKNIQSRYRK